MKTFRILFFLFCAAVLMGSCNILGGFDSDCDRMVQIKFKWIETDPRINLDSVAVVFIAPDGTIHHTNSDKEGKEVDLPPNQYEVVGWEPAEHVSISGNIISLETDNDQMAKEPEAFNAGSTFLEIADDLSSPLFYIPLYRQTRPLILQVRFNECANKVQGVKGLLSGIAKSRDVNYAFFTTEEGPRYPAYSSCSIRYNFGLDEEGWYTDEKVLLGISGEEEQILKLEINLTDGTLLSLDYAVTDKLDNFYVEETHKPWVIQLTFDIGCGGDEDEITIVDWKTGPKTIIVVS